MKISDLLTRERIHLDGTASGKIEVIAQAVALMAESGNIADIEAYHKGVLAREELGSTGIGGGIAIPHCKSEAVTAPGLAAMVIRDGVEFDALDGGKVHLLFLIAAPDTGDNVHLEVLSRLSALLMKKGFREKLISAASPEEFLKVIEAAETLILAVTACPTGIAHTYMAAEALEQKAKEMGYAIRVETRGSGGVANELTEEEIERATGIIVAADTQVPMERFAGKPVIQCKVSEGIGKAEKLMNRIVAGDAPVYAGQDTSVKKTGESNRVDTEKKAYRGHNIYKHLMNGVSHMLPFVVGGGILIALAFLIDGFAVDINALSMAERANFGSITKVAAMLKDMGSIAFEFMLPILAGYIAMSIADRPGLAVGFVGGALAANGTSGFLGALVAGFLAGFVVRLLRKVFRKLPKSLEGIKPMLLYPLLGTFLTGLLMIFVVEPPVGALNALINDGLAQMNDSGAVLLGALLAGMMSVDMGGPVNKAAYVFGTASIASANYHIMAAVMVGGMVPPLAIAMATLLFPKKFTSDERRAGLTNFVLGLSFITEGAIPFAAADPLRVIPSCVAGSAAAGALSVLFGCSLMAPHGGIFVFPTVGNAIGYLTALVSGALIGCLVLGMLKKNKEDR